MTDATEQRLTHAGLAAGLAVALGCSLAAVATLISIRRSSSLGAVHKLGYLTPMRIREMLRDMRLSESRKIAGVHVTRNSADAWSVDEWASTGGALALSALLSNQDFLAVGETV